MSEAANQVGSNDVKPRTIDAAIDECDTHIRRHKVFSWFTLIVLVAGWFFLYKAYDSKNSFDDKLNNYFSNNPTPANENYVATVASNLASQNHYVSYFFLATFVVWSSLLIALYR